MPMGDYGILCLTGAPPTEGAAQSERSAQALASLLEGWFESELELNQLVDEHVSTTNQLIALYNITRSTRETLELGDKLRTIVGEAGRQTGCARAILEVRLEDEAERFIWTADGHASQRELEKILARVRQRGEAHISSSGADYVAAPVPVKDQTTGWLVAGQRADSRPYQARELKILQALADLAAGFVLTDGLQTKVIHNLKLEKELEIASRIGEMLIPHELPRVDGLDVAALCRPASEVGGDFYTAQRLDDGSLAFSLGDVTGKGVPAALLMSMTRTVFRTLSMAGSSPAEALNMLSQALYEDLNRVEKFVTIAVGRFQPREMKLEIANAGHSPVFFLENGAAQPRLLEPTGPPVGILADSTVETETLTMPEGSVLALASDGLHEMKDEHGALFGVHRLGRALAGLAASEAQCIVDQLFQQVQEHAGGMSHWDDQTLLILKRVTRK
ncbi:MAG: SpoIIE family protein phosphatase [Candidatus Eisenbacteria bacterium]|nr:SpoIIE family protein phosphatase [Candidatus Eisenbacteria bacterium]